MSIRTISRIAAAGLLLCLGACTQARSPDPAATTPAEADPASGGGTLRIAGPRLGELDPARSYSTSSWFLARGVFRTLVAPGPAGPDDARPELIGDLATDTGTPSDDWTRWTFTLRDEARFGPALGGREIEGVTGEPIVCDDLKYGLERLFRAPVGAAYPFYYEVLEGTEAFRSGAADEVTGISCPDEATIVFQLDGPVPDWPLRLSLPAATAVPRAVAESLDGGESTYGQAPIATGPYFLQAVEDDRILLERNEHWDAAGDPVRRAGPRRVRWRTDLGSTSAIERVIEGRLDLLVGIEPRGPRLAALVEDRTTSRLLVHETSGCARFIYLDTTRPPFDELAVRRAVARALDRYVLKRMVGGPAAGMVATSVLPPGIPGHLSAEEFDPFPSPHGTGDIAAARRMLARAGFTDRNADILVAGAEGLPGTDFTRSVRADLERLGFTNVRSRAFDAGEVDRFYSASPARVHVGTTMTWCKDVDDASTILRPLFHGDSTSGATNYNFPRLDDTRLNELIGRATSLPPGSERRQAWEAANRRATELAAWIPWGWDAVTILHGARLADANYLSFLTHIDWPNVRIEP